MENLQIMDKTLDKKLDAVMTELADIRHKLDALIYALTEDEDGPAGDEFGLERDSTQTL